ncbi:CPBP family intramembrane metalloprotease [Actinoplanes sp. LDG1-06]|uniref:CPBP family intramembrane metalloprotease n=1 Tax=Paractinoplanes ovalisporus TaxID=2810368 RepID=A0ABS2AS82_9ACTN|nr:type II CAAX endopeptidase family protein [Actinoplanes ovalisporus]MBM2622739.1 CPBP family intramembrane metalloprotease [Actinoplanes ovalisporus]
MTFPQRRPIFTFFLLTFGLTWLFWLPYVLSANGLGVFPWRFPSVLGSSQTLGLLPGAYLGPVTSALLVTAVTQGRPGLRRWARRLVRWRVGLRWYAGVLFVVPAVMVASTLLLPDAAADMTFPSAATLVAYLPLLVLQVLTTGLSEEPGWRDFAQPRLQARFGPLTGSLVIGPLWGAWHLPLFFTEWAGWPDVDWRMPAEFVLSSVLLSIVLTWVFNRSGESLPLAMLLHANVNTVFSLAWPQIFPRLDAFSDSLHALVIGSGLAALVLIVATRGRLGAPPPSTPCESQPETTALRRV